MEMTLKLRLDTQARKKRVLDDHVGEGLGQVTRVGPKELQGNQVTGTEGEQGAVSHVAGEQARSKTYRLLLKPR